MQKACDSIVDSLEDGVKKEEMEEQNQEEAVLPEECGEDEVFNMDEVEIEYLEEEYLTEGEEEGVNESVASFEEGQILIKSENETAAVILPEGIKVEEGWQLVGENLAVMLVEDEKGGLGEQVLEGIAQDEEDIAICGFCEKPVRSNSYEEHLKLVHTFKYCDLCKTEVKEIFFNAHMKSHEESKVFCELCNKFFRKQDFVKHCKKHQGLDALDKRESVNRKVCDICGYQVEGKGTLNKHMREKHDEGQNYCELCEKYVWIKCYDKHIKDVHEDHEEFCKECQKMFKYYKTHMRTSHNDVIKFCDYCQVDVEADTFENHMATVHSKQSRFCETCNKEFFEFVCYKNHVRNIHLKVKSYKCSECEFTTAYRTSMDKHILGTHTRNEKYVCEICAKEFIVKDNLRKHIRMIHNGQQRSVCNYCGKVCHANRELINHVRLHTGDLPYQCEYCLRKFPKKWTLDNHRRIHTGEKPYKCTHCDSAFGTSAQMKIHEFREHGVEKYRHVDRTGKRRKAENIFEV